VPLQAATGRALKIALPLSHRNATGLKSAINHSATQQKLSAGTSSQFQSVVARGHQRRAAMILAGSKQAGGKDVLIYLMTR
jgi:hypothetical protein